MRQGPQPTRRIVPKLATIVGYASSEFYHFVLEALPRLALLMPALLADRQMQLAVPTTRAKLIAREGFVAELLALVLPNHVYRTRLLAYAHEHEGAPGERIVASSRLLWADWPSFAHADGAPTHCLTPAYALEAAAAMVDEAWGAAVANGTAISHRRLPAARPLVVYAARRDVSMRRLVAEDDAALHEVLYRVVESEGAELAVYNGTGGVRAAVQLFRHASVIVGVHGGALSNLLWSATGKPSSARRSAVLLVELTVASRISIHYAHAASALGMRYRAIPLVDDEHGVGAATVTLPPQATDEVQAAVEAHLRTTAAATRSKDELR